MKTYVKPELYYEHFELSQHIAACALKLNSGSVHDCTATSNPDMVPDGSGSITFFIDAAGCDPSTEEIICYFNGSGSHVTFMS